MSEFIKFIVVCNPDLDKASMAARGAITERRDTFFFDENITVADALELAGFSRKFIKEDQNQDITSWYFHPNFVILGKDNFDFKLDLTLRDAYCDHSKIDGVMVRVMKNNGWCDIFKRRDCSHCERCPGACGA